MKKNYQNKPSINSDIVEKNDLKLDNIKTTNVNILLNRVRLDHRKTLKKRIIFSIVLISVVSSLALYFIV